MSLFCDVININFYFSKSKDIVISHLCRFSFTTIFLLDLVSHFYDTRTHFNIYLIYNLFDITIYFVKKQGQNVC